MTFAEYLREHRISMGFTMRQFAATKGYDVAYISRLESGIISAPADIEKLKALAFAVDLKEETTEWIEFFDLAAASRNQIPEDLKNNPLVPRILPAFYRTLRKDKITEDEVSQLVKMILGETNDQAPKTGDGISVKH